MIQGFCVWLTGPGGSGKHTVAGLLAGVLRGRGLVVEALDTGLSQVVDSQGMNRVASADRENEARRLGRAVTTLVRGGRAVIVADDAVGREVREKIRAEAGDFIEVFFNGPVDVPGRESVGDLSEPGVEASYEPPENPEVALRTNEEDPGDCLARILRVLEISGYAPPVNEDLSEPEAEAVERKLKDLGYI